MKKIIILLMAVSIMLTSCGKSAGLSNIDKKAGNKTSLAGSDKKNLPQNTKGFWHTATNFLWDHKIGVGITALSLIALGSAYHYRKDLAYWILNDDKKELEKAKENLNELNKDFKDKHDCYKNLTESHRIEIAKNRNLEKDKAELNSQIEAQKFNLTNLEYELKNASDANERNVKIISDLTLQVNSYSNRIKHLEGLEIENQNQLVRIKQLEKENKDKQDYENLAEQNKILSAELEQLKRTNNEQASELDQFKLAIENLSQKNGILSAEIEALKQPQI